MSRIAAGVLIAVVVLALNGMALRPSLAEEAATPAKVAAGRATDAPIVVKTPEGSRVLALVMALRALQAEAKR